MAGKIKYISYHVKFWYTHIFVIGRNFLIMAFCWGVGWGDIGEILMDLYLVFKA